MLSVGDVVDGKYQVVRELGAGAMGVVYEARHLALGRRVAMKTLRKELGDDANLAVRFQQEARAASAIGHPNIIDVFDLGRTSDGRLYMVMELLDGRPLSALIDEAPKMAVDRTIALMSQVLGALGAAHKNGIVHRDLKPDNIFVVETEDRPSFVKLLDFGISKILAERTSQQLRAHNTAFGVVMGTPAYMSPEQARGQVELIDARTDLYAAGVVLYEMLCGRTPFQGDNYNAVLAAIVDGEFPMPRRLRADLPPALERVITTALAIRRDDRYSTAAAMRDAMTSAGGVGAGAAAPASGGGNVLELDLPSIGELELVRVSPPPSLVATVASRPAPLPAAEPAKPPPEPPKPAKAAAGSTPPATTEPPAPYPTASLALDDSMFRPPDDADEVPALAIDAPAPRTPTRFPTPRPIAPAPVTRSLSTPPLARPASPPATARQRGASAVDLGVVHRRRAPVRALVLLAFLGLCAAGYFVWRGRVEPEQRGWECAFALTPPYATVELDGKPSVRAPLWLRPGSVHVVVVSAPNHLSRKVYFAAAPGDIAIRLPHAIPPLSPRDPPPERAERSAVYPAVPASLAEIDAALAEIVAYEACLDPMARAYCRTRLEALALAPPALRAIEAAAAAYVAAPGEGDKPSAAETALRAELLAARTQWELDELARLEQDEGRTAAWYMRAVLLDARAIARGRPLPVGESFQALSREFAAYRREHPNELARIAGAVVLINAASELEQLLDTAPKDRAAHVAAFNRLAEAFDALVLEE